MKNIYEQVTRGNRYDFPGAGKHNMEMIKSDVTAKDLPAIEQAFISENHYGCCLHYGMTLFKLMREAGYEAYIAITKEENPLTGQKTDNHVSVCYIINGERFIADPVETVKGTDGNFLDIPIEDFRKANGTIWIFDPYGEYGGELFFNGFLSHPLDVIQGD